ncbi:MAG: hypothetical protein CME19_12885 [Gemmatimonadetes bacterium]|nr:hypothetical protein [Gemmatimonadota bacterium]|tara:strand:- start:84 stop:1448 length:1365 start_codon:yes stop_codon:yes gene_type:complete
MDRVTQFLSDRPQGATAEEIAREALGLKGAVGPVAAQVIRAASEEDPRIVEERDGLWVFREKGGDRRLRETTYVIVASRDRDDGAVEFGIVRATFDGIDSVETYTVEPGAAESAVRVIEQLSTSIGACLPSGFRLSSARRRLNGMARLYIGRTIVPSGICIARLARRCFRNVRIRSSADVAEALGLPYFEPSSIEEDVKTQTDLLLGLLEQYESRGLDTIDSVLDELRPTLTDVDFEAFTFDEAYLDDLPTDPGVYVMRDAEGKVIYVGKSVHLRDRVKTYFSRRSEREQKTLRILERIWTVELEVVGSELEAMILEARLIQATRPEFNKQVAIHDRGKPDDAPFVLVLPSADRESVELLCVRPDAPIGTVRVRKDLADWEDGWSELKQCLAYVPEVDEDEVARKIVWGWIDRNREKVNLVRPEDVGEALELKRVLADHISDTTDEAWEKVWRI